MASEQNTVADYVNEAVDRHEKAIQATSYHVGVLGDKVELSRLLDLLQGKLIRLKDTAKGASGSSVRDTPPNREFEDRRGKVVLETANHAGVLVTGILLGRPFLTAFYKKGPGCHVKKFLYVLVFCVTFCVLRVVSARPNPDFYAHTDLNAGFPPAAFP